MKRMTQKECNKLLNDICYYNVILMEIAKEENPDKRDIANTATYSDIETDIKPRLFDYESEDNTVIIFPFMTIEFDGCVKQEILDYFFKTTKGKGISEAGEYELIIDIFRHYISSQR